MHQHLGWSAASFPVPHTCNMALAQQQKGVAQTKQARTLPASLPVSTRGSSRRFIRCSALADVSRRQVLAISIGAIAISPSLAAHPALAAAKAPGGFNVCEDTRDGYKFVYPFGWQEVAVTGSDVVFKDIVEPLEFVSVTLTKTDKSDITEFGDIQTVAETLASKVLTAPTQKVAVVSTKQRELNGHNYYEFEFTASNSNYNKHQLAVVAVTNGTFYTLTTGSNERRWGKMKERLETVTKSFTLGTSLSLLPA